MPVDCQKLASRCKSMVVFSLLPPSSLPSIFYLPLSLILLMSDIWIAHGSVLLITADGARAFSSLKCYYFNVMSSVLLNNNNSTRLAMATLSLCRYIPLTLSFSYLTVSPILTNFACENTDH